MDKELCARSLCSLVILTALRTIEDSEKVRIDRQIRKVKQDLAKIQG